MPNFEEFDVTKVTNLDWLKSCLSFV
jgi:hypothetical protein